MKKLKMGLAALATLAMLLMLLMPYLTGRVAESVTQRLAAQINQNNPEYGELSVLEYQRGFRSTQSRFSWKSSQLSNSSLKPEVVLKCDGSHGVFTYSYNCQFENAERYTDFVNQRLDGVNPLTISGSVSLLGGMHHSFHLDAFEIDNDGDAISVLPGFISVVSDKNFESFVIDGEFQGVEAEGPDGLLLLGSTSLSGKVRQNELDLAIGDVTLVVQNIDMESKDQGKIEIHGLVFSSEALENGEALNVSYLLEVEKFKQSGVMGDLSVANLIMNFRVEGIDMMQMSFLNQKLNALDQQPDSVQNASLLALLPAFESMLIPGLSLEFQLSADHLASSVDANLTMSLTNNLTLGDFLLFSVNPRNLFTKMNVGLTNKMPYSFVDENPNLQSAMALSPWHVKSEDAYTTDFRIADGSIQLNKNELEINAFLAMLGIQISKRGWGRGL